MKKRQSIVYVNFTPYDNTGKILDFIISNFSLVLHFSYDHLRLKNGRRSRLMLYKNKKIIFQKDLIWLRTNSWLLFPSLPLVALAIFLQTMWYTHRLKNIYGPFHHYLSVNAYTAWIGNCMRNLGFVRKTIYWVWDYYPVNYPDWRLKLIRILYWQFDKPSRSSSNRVLFLNKNLQLTRDVERKNNIVPMGTDPSRKNISADAASDDITIGYLGMLKKSQGLDLLFDNLESLKKTIPKLRIEIIGSGPDEEYFNARSRKHAAMVTMYGFVENDRDVKEIMKHWSVGLATYIPFAWSEHYWTDPSKIKAYLSAGIPVLMTNVPSFASEIQQYQAGFVINYDQGELMRGIHQIIKRPGFFSKNAYKLAQKYRYTLLYPRLFT